MRKVTAALIGAGQRGAEAYASYGLAYPDEIQFVAVAERDPVRRERFKQAHNLPEQHAYANCGCPCKVISSPSQRRIIGIEPI